MQNAVRIGEMNVLIKKRLREKISYLKISCLNLVEKQIIHAVVRGLKSFQCWKVRGLVGMRSVIPGTKRAHQIFQ